MAQARTRTQARRWFQAHGLSVREWARSEGIPASVVYALLSGRTRGLRGKAHRAAIALGLKLDPKKSDAGAPPQRDGVAASEQGERALK